MLSKEMRSRHEQKNHTQQLDQLVDYPHVANIQELSPNATEVEWLLFLLFLIYISQLMKKGYYLALLLFLGMYSQINAQQRLYAGAVINFSTQYDVYPYGWSAYQLLGPPNVYPQYGDIPDAFNPAAFGVQRDFIELGFDNNGPIDSIFIWETFTPGFVDSVFVKNPGTQNWDLVYATVASPGPATSHILAIGFPMTTYPVKEVRLTLANDSATGWVELDAVAISPVTTNTFTPETTPGSAYNFDGINDAYHTYCNLLNLITDTGATFTAWINIHQNAAPSVVDAFAGTGVLCDADGTYLGVYLANMGGNDSLYFYNYDGADQFFGMDYTPDTWFHIAWVHSNGMLKAYKNGILYRSIPSGTTNYIGMRALEMGYNLSSGEFFEGEIDEVASFNRGLNATEIYNLMRMNIPANMTGMTGYWQMSNCDETHFYNPQNHIADSLDGVNCTVSGVPDYTLVENNKGASSFVVYPNPSSGLVYVKTNQVQVDHFILYDMMGRSILQKNMAIQELFSIDLTSVSPGIYTLELVDRFQKSYSVRIVKN
jgi:hypothetical protein